MVVEGQVPARRSFVLPHPPPVPSRFVNFAFPSFAGEVHHRLGGWGGGEREGLAVTVVTVIPAKQGRDDNLYQKGGGGGAGLGIVTAKQVKPGHYVWMPHSGVACCCRRRHRL